MSDYEVTLDEMAARLDDIFTTNKRLTRAELAGLLRTLTKVEEQAIDDAVDPLAANFHTGRYSGYLMAGALLRQLDDDPNGDDAPDYTDEPCPVCGGYGELTGQAIGIPCPGCGGSGLRWG